MNNPGKQAGDVILNGNRWFGVILVLRMYVPKIRLL